MAGVQYRKTTIMEAISERLIFPNNGCWEFYGATTGQGYGNIHYQGRKQYVHRIVFRIMNGKIPHGILVLHNCDNPRCCNPDHLFLGTHKDNTADMIAKDRQGWDNKPTKASVLWRRI